MKNLAVLAVIFSMLLAGCTSTPKPDVIIKNVMPEPPAELMKPPAKPKTISVPE